jgi:hypothetical protein
LCDEAVEIMPSEILTPNDTHASATQICATIFNAVGLTAERVVDYKDGYDFLVGGRVRVACRYAMPTSDRQQVYTKRNGEVSTYSYKRWTFNFHRHGRIPDRYCDFFVCFLVGPEAASGGASEVSVFVIPWDAITGLTFCSSVREGSARGYRGKYAVYQDAWELIENAARGRRASTGRKTLRISTDSRRRLKLILSGDGNRPSFTAVIPNLAARRAQRKDDGSKPDRTKKRAQVLRLRVE